MGNPKILIGATYRFVDRWGGSAQSKLDSIASTVDSWWHDQIDLTGDHPASFSSADSSNTISAYTPSDESLGYRLGDIQQNADEAYDLTAWDGIVVADHWVDGDSYGMNTGTGTPTLGEDTQDIVAVVDCGYEDNGSLPYAWQSLGSEGIAFHELLNIANALDTAAKAVYMPDNLDYYTVMWDGEGTGCGSAGSPSAREYYVGEGTDCNTDRVQNYYDDNTSNFEG